MIHDEPNRLTNLSILSIEKEITSWFFFSYWSFFRDQSQKNNVLNIKFNVLEICKM